MEAILELTLSAKFGLNVIGWERRKTDSQKTKTASRKNIKYCAEQRLATLDHSIAGKKQLE